MKYFFIFHFNVKGPILQTVKGSLKRKCFRDDNITLCSVIEHFSGHGNEIISFVTTKKNLIKSNMLYLTLYSLYASVYLLFITNSLGSTSGNSCCLGRLASVLIHVGWKWLCYLPVNTVSIISFVGQIAIFV